MTFCTYQNRFRTNCLQIDWLTVIVSFQPITEFSDLVSNCEDLTRVDYANEACVFNSSQLEDRMRGSKISLTVFFTSDTELATVDWDVGLQVVNITSRERIQLLGPTLFVRIYILLNTRQILSTI